MLFTQYQHKIEAALQGDSIVKQQYCMGGSVGEVWHISTQKEGQYIVKIAQNHDLHNEAAMLRILKAHVVVPAIIACTADFMILEYIENDGSILPPSYEHLAHMIALLHQQKGTHYGYDIPTYLGRVQQKNDYSPDWVSFYSNNRLYPLMRQNHDKGYISYALCQKIEKLCHKLPQFLCNASKPALIHGDLWGGNILWHNGACAALIDPALYYADTEIEIAYMSLFDHIDPIFYDIYQQYHPLSANFFIERQAIYQLYPLLVHALLFQAPYPDMVNRVVEQFV